MDSLSLVACLLVFAFLFAVSHHLRFVLRTAVLIILIALATSYAMASYFVLKVFGGPRATNDINSQLGFAYRHLTNFFLPLRVEMVGDLRSFDQRRPAVFVCNHQSEMDFVAMANVFPKDTVILAKESIKYIPFMGWYMWLAGNVFINRENNKSAVDTMAKVAAIIEEKKVKKFVRKLLGSQANAAGRCFHVPRRNTITANDKPGAFYLAIQGQIPVVPMVVSSYHDIFNIKNMLFEGGIIRVKLLKPIETAGLTIDDVEKLSGKRVLNAVMKLKILKSADVYQSMSDTLVEISGPVPSFAEPLKIQGKKKR
ncbi:1-acylglycerol-3-phosphate O-acyltransferase [Entophlyctis sp. JEL0112]|nr:1-acylglycerol-3-phosphate O-acyltransferase [Entophlyctis sp. JEL0112]